MGLKETILSDIKEAMKSKNSQVLECLRFLQSAVKNKEIELRPNEIGDADILGVIQKMAKKHQDAIEQFEKAGRQDLAEKERSQKAVVERYLPEPLSSEELQQLVVGAIEAVGASSMKEMGAVMKRALELSEGRADNKALSQAIRQALSS